MAKEIIYKITADTGEADKNVTKLEKDMTNLAEAHDMVANSNRSVNSTFEEVYGNIKPLSASLGELEDRMYQLALGGQQNTQEFQELQAEAVRFRQVLISVDKSVDQLAEQGRGLGTALQLGTAVASGYGVLQGGMALLGDESEELQKTFVKLQAVQTVLASLEQLKLSLDKQSLIVTKAKTIATNLMSGAQAVWTAITNGTTTAMVALKVAMLAIPIVAIIAGIVSLVVVIKSLISATVSLEEINENLNASYEKGIDTYTRSYEAFKRNSDNKLALAKANGASEEEIHNMEMERLKKEEVNRKNLIKIEEVLLEKKKALYRASLAAGNEDLAKSTKEEIETIRNKYKDLRALDGQYAVDKKLKEIEYNKKLEEEEKANNEKAKSNAEKANADARARREKRLKEEEDARMLSLERQKTIQDLMNANIEDADLRSLMQLQTKHKREQDELVAKYGKDAELIKQLEQSQANETIALNKDIADKIEAEKEGIRNKEIEAKKTAQSIENSNDQAYLQGKLLQLRDDFDARMEVEAELIELEREIALQNKELTEGELFLIDEQYNEKKRLLAEQTAEHEKQLNEDIKQATIQTGEQGISALTNLSDAYFGNKLAKAEKGSASELALMKKQFEINKKLQIAQAIMQGVQAVQAAYSSGSAIPIVGAVTGPVFAALAGVASVLNINKIKNTKFEGGASSVSAPSVQTPSIPSASDIVGGEDNDSTLTAGLPNNANKGNTNKVVLVDSDVKASLANSEKVAMISSFG